MNAFRFLSVLTVGFSLLVFVFLLNATQGRLEAEAVRVLTGPDVPLVDGQTATWKLHLGGDRIEEAWPAPQRQPRLFLAGLGDGADLVATATATYSGDGVAAVPALKGGPSVEGAAGETPGELAFGPLWMSWEEELTVEVTVDSVASAGGGGSPRLELRGEPTKNYMAARAMARTLWAVFTAIAAAGFAGLMLTLGKSSGGPGQPPASARP